MLEEIETGNKKVGQERKGKESRGEEKRRGRRYADIKELKDREGRKKSKGIKRKKGRMQNKN